MEKRRWASRTSTSAGKRKFRWESGRGTKTRARKSTENQQGRRLRSRMRRDGGRGVAAGTGADEREQQPCRPGGGRTGASRGAKGARQPSGRKGSAGQRRAKWRQAGGGGGRVEGRGARMAPRGTWVRAAWAGVARPQGPRGALRCRNWHLRLCTSPPAGSIHLLCARSLVRSLRPFRSSSPSMRPYAAAAIICLFFFFFFFFCCCSLTVFPCLCARRCRRRLFLGLRSRGLTSKF